MTQNTRILAPTTLLPFFLAWQLEPANDRYNLCFSYRLPDRNLATTLPEKLQKLINSKAYLRQTFFLENEKLFINFQDNVAVDINYCSSNNLDFPELEQRLIKAPHDLINGPLIKLTMVDFTDSSDCIVLFNIHHILMDAGTLDAFIDDLNTLLANDSISPESITEYCSLLAQENKAATPQLDSELTAYINQVNNIAAKLEHTSTNEKNCLHYTAILPNDTKNILYDFAKQQGITPFNLLLVVWGVFVAKIFNQSLALIDYPVDIRRNKQIEGCFLNIGTYPINIMEADNYLSLVSALKYERSVLKRAVSLNLRNTFKLEKIPAFGYSNFAQPASLTISNKSYLATSYAQIANANLSVRYCDKDNICYFSCDIFADLFPEYFSNTLLPRFFNYLATLLKNPVLKINHSDLIFNDERQKLLSDFNDTTTPYPEDKTLIDLFDNIVTQYPNKIALSAWNGKLTYAQLNEKAENVAAYLIQNHVKPDDIIAILIDNRLEMIIAIMAVLKAGAAYLPIAHDMPEARMMYILADSEAKFLLTLPELTKIHDLVIPVVNIAEQSNIKNSYTKPILTPQNLAYLIYTSGTTGKPKGVLIEHGNVINYLTYLIQYNQLDHTSVGSKYADFSFDASVIEIYPILLSGGTLCLLENKNKLDCAKIDNFFKQNHVNYAFLPTQVAEIFLKSTSSTLTTLIVGGDKLKTFTEQSCRVINAYGPTEATVQATGFLVTNTSNNIPIGKPINNVQCYVVDKDYNLCPIGLTGELFIGGSGLARGYHNAPEITAEKFIVNKFFTKPANEAEHNSRLYKTGDLVRYLPDGNLEYIGRKDFQIKVRGYRIEIAEIESALLLIPELEQIFVTTFEHNEGDKILCAYYTSKKPINVDIVKLKLSAHLAGYMIPHYFIWLEKFPVTLNGKIDKKSLPAPTVEGDLKYVAPRNEKEQLICSAFSSILNRDHISIYDDFFKLGGDSLKAISLAPALQKNFDIDIPDIYRLKTPKKIAENTKFAKNILLQRLEKIKTLYQSSTLFSRLSLSEQNKKDAYLASISQTKFSIQSKPIKNVLLTGSTGYLGCNLLHQLLQITTHTIFLLIRADSPEEAFSRVNKKFQFYFDTSLAAYKSRLVILAGDLEKDNLNLSANQYQILVNDLDSIIHAAALTKHYGHYDKSYSANVQATLNLLDLSALTQLKDFHYISTSSVFGSHDFIESEYRIFTEDDLVDTFSPRDNVYIKTKYKGEEAVISYRARGVSGNIYRVGNLAFIADNYRPQENKMENAFIQRLNSLLKLKIAPKEIKSQDISPVDLTAQAIIRLFDKKISENKVYHIFNPNLFNVADFFAQETDLSVKLLAINEFIDTITDYLKNPKYKKLAERFLLHQGWMEEMRDEPHSIQILQDKTNAILNQLGFQWPIIKPLMFKKFLAEAGLCSCSRKTILLSDLHNHELNYEDRTIVIPLTEIGDRNHG